MSTTTESPPFFTVGQLAERWEISPRTVLHRINRGEIAANKADPERLTSAWLIDASEVERIEAVPGEGVPSPL